MSAIKYFLLFSLVSNNLTNYGRRHFKLFTNCHVSWEQKIFSYTKGWVKTKLEQMKIFQCNEQKKFNRTKI